MDASLPRALLRLPVAKILFGWGDVQSFLPAAANVTSTMSIAAQQP